MKVIWEEDDIEGGLVLRQTGNRELFITAYHQDSTGNFLVSLADGMIIPTGLTKGAAAGYLNTHRYQPFNQIRTYRTVADLLTDTRRT